MQDELDIILRRRVTPMAPAGLAERIIMAAREQKRAGRFDIREFWVIFKEELLLPQPAFVLAAVLLLSAGIGFNSQIQSYLTDADSQVISAFTVVDNSYEDGAPL